MGNYTEAIEANQPSESNAKEIEIIFENKNKEISIGDEVGKYHSHPAFNAFDVNGLWVAKFETTGDLNQFTSKPNLLSLRSLNVKTIFEATLNYNRKNESHMMKNTEWGAVTYLSLSKYGINDKININNNVDYLTGYSAVIGLDQSTFPGTFGNTSSVTLPYNTETGYLASTTGNISGIYDMSGGAHEYMAAYVKNKLSASGFASDPAVLYGEKYFDVYNKNSDYSTYNYRILGDATSEFGPFYKYNDKDGNLRAHNSWYGNASFFPGQGSAWIHRGGNYEDGILTGQTNFSRFTGGSGFNIGFRIILAI